MISLIAAMPFQADAAGGTFMVGADTFRFVLDHANDRDRILAVANI